MFSHHFLLPPAYIKTVDTIVWSPPRILAEFLSHDIPHSSNPHKLADTLVTLESWRRVVEKYHHPAARDTADEEEQEQEPATQAHIRGLSTSPPPQRLQVVDTRETTMMSLDNILGRVSEDERRWEKQYKSDTAEDNIPE